MSLRLIDIAVLDKHAHPRLHGRVGGVVRAVLEDDAGGLEQTHEILVRVKILVSETMSVDDVDLALMVRAGEIIKRVRGRFEAAEQRLGRAAE